MRLRTALAGTVLALPFAMPAHATPPQADTWNFRQIHVGQSQAAGRDGAGVTVAVVDTWVDRSHPDLGGRVLPGADCSGGTCTPGPVAADKCDAHGTHVAGTIASRTYGVAPAARILPLRVLKWDGTECQGLSGDVAAAIRYAVAHDARVVNVSLGATVPLAGKDADLDDAVTEAAQAGVLVVFAAGNQDLPVTDSFGPDALIVAATARDGGLASYSQHGTGVDLAAPGGDSPTDTCTLDGCVISTWWDGKHVYAALAGTSMAAPHVSGIAALLFAQRPRSRNDVVARLRGTAHPLAQAGSGLVDAAAALGASAAPRATATPTSPNAVVRVTPKRSTPKAKPRTAAPTPPATPKPAPKRPAPTPAPVPSPTVVEPPLALPSREEDRTVPLTAAALLLAAVAAATVASARRT
ncbi:MAG: thermitase [Frankiaceae bacterium]|jgi:subtilisin family serine protease|nr:thermitase [Frankiaceae bacterium]